MRPLKKQWKRHLTREEKLFTGRALAVVSACGCAFLLHFYLTTDPLWVCSGWFIPYLLWAGAEYVRLLKRPAYCEVAFACGAGYGLIGVFVTELWIGHVATAFVALCWAGFQFGLGYWPESSSDLAVVTPVPPPAPPTTFGSARWGTLEYMLEHGLFGDDGIMLGVIPGDDKPHRLRYRGDRHLMTIAPNRSGKGTSAIIPNLLTYRGSCFVVDPKAENAIITSRQRECMGQRVHVVDPWSISGLRTSRLNPLDWLARSGLEIADNAMILADALVVPDAKGDSFWSDEAKGLLQGLILHVATNPDEAGCRHLGRVRDLLLLGGEEMTELFERMLDSTHHVVRSTGARSLQKDPKTFANVIASAQAQTVFLDSPYLRESLSVSDFKFEDLKARSTTIYLVLPADRLNAFGRWLRLLIQQAITVSARDIANKPAKPVLFILDEMAALGRLNMVEQAYGLMAGFGMQLWGIVQDAGQMRRIYGESWETFIANSGAVTYYGSRDNLTAEYFSKLCGVATVLNFSSTRSFSSTNSFSSTSGGQSGSYTSGSSYTQNTSATISHVQRKLAFPDELMRLDSRMQLVLIDNHQPVLAEKLPWFQDPELRLLGRNLHLEGIEHGRGSDSPSLQFERETAAQVVQPVQRPLPIGSHKG